MSILIKGAKMPSNCMGCPYEIYVNCIIYQALSARDYSDCRHPDCPLVEIPPHGDLIDVDNLIEDIEELDNKPLIKWLKRFVNGSAVVIESEEENERSRDI